MMIGLGLLMLLLFGGFLLALVGGGSALLDGAGQRLGNQNERHTTPRHILDARLARGEISLDEYEALRTRIED